MGLSDAHIAPHLSRGVGVGAILLRQRTAVEARVTDCGMRNVECRMYVVVVGNKYEVHVLIEYTCTAWCPLSLALGGFTQQSRALHMLGLTGRLTFELQ